MGMFYRGQSSIPFFIYGSIHFEPQNGLGIVSYIGSFFFIFYLNIFLLQYKGIGIRLTTGFIVTYIGLTNDSIVTYIGLTNDSIVTYIGLTNDSIVTYIGLTNDSIETYIGLTNDSIVTYIGLTNDNILTTLTVA